jgi:hypothetical protein
LILCNQNSLLNSFAALQASDYKINSNEFEDFCQISFGNASVNLNPIKIEDLFANTKSQEKAQLEVKILDNAFFNTDSVRIKRLVSGINDLLLYKIAEVSSTKVKLTIGLTDSRILLIRWEVPTDFSNMLSLFTPNGDSQ